VILIQFIPIYIEQMLHYKVNGIISDNPAVVLQLLKEKNIKTIFEK
jgi:hypothetical protein